jgi:hypothetical protein
LQHGIETRGGRVENAVAEGVDISVGNRQMVLDLVNDVSYGALTLRDTRKSLHATFFETSRTGRTLWT